METNTTLKEIIDSLVSKILVAESAKEAINGVLEDGQEATGHKKAELRKMASLEYLRRYEIDKYLKQKDQAEYFDIIEHLFVSGDE